MVASTAAACPHCGYRAGGSIGATQTFHPLRAIGYVCATILFFVVLFNVWQSIAG
jgi:hypothetical protein